jgi:hypothetical protein
MERTKTQRKRDKKFFLSDGETPKYLRIYDNGGETADRYTVVFTGRYRHKTMGEFWVLGMSGAPRHPQGVCMHDTYTKQVDWPTYGHLGRKILFRDLPTACQEVARFDYCYLNDVEPTNA